MNTRQAMTRNEQRQHRQKSNRTYFDKKKEQGIILHSFLIRREMVKPVRQFIEEQFAILNTPTTPQVKV
jgi:hypothetical protein